MKTALFIVLALLLWIGLEILDRVIATGAGEKCITICSHEQNKGGK